MLVGIEFIVMFHRGGGGGRGGGRGRAVNIYSLA